MARTPSQAVNEYGTEYGRIEMFNTYKEDFERMKTKYEKLRQEYKELEGKYDLERKLTTSLTSRLTNIADEFDEFLTKYEKVVASPDYYNKEREDFIALLKEQATKAYGCGRQDAYAELGVRNIEAHERGNALVMLENGDIVELITDLETVYEEKPPAVADDEIVIDDLLEVSA